MPNFAQEFPLLLFLPFLILGGVALTVGVIHIVLVFESKMKLPRLAQSARARNAFAAKLAALPADRRNSPKQGTTPWLVSTKM